MASNLEFFRKDSDLHKVTEENGGFSISPKLENLESLQKFQSVAKQAIKYINNEFKTIPHNEKETGFNYIDSVFFQALRK